MWKRGVHTGPQGCASDQPRSLGPHSANPAAHEIQWWFSETHAREGPLAPAAVRTAGSLVAEAQASLLDLQPTVFLKHKVSGEFMKIQTLGVRL